MLSNMRLTLSVLAVALGCGCTGERPAPPKTGWPLDHQITMPARIRVLSGTTFLSSGVRCQLLGVREADDPARREQALAFTRAWFRSVGNYIGFYNDYNPLVLADGTCIIWVRGYDSTLSCLNIELVRAGLVDVDVASWRDYDFKEEGKGDPVASEWKEKLQEAKEGHHKGEKPRAHFPWPVPPGRPRKSSEPPP
jgi:hypothetical protein